jgi:ankyrin repeat protein
VDFMGGLTPLMFAARQGNMDAVVALVAAGADVNQVNPGDKSSPMLVATVNGKFDIAMYLLAHGGDPNLASTANATPLYAALNVQWAPHAFYPQPSPAQQKTSHLELMDALLKAGANPNVRLSKKLWYTGYNFDQSGVDAKGTTAFWRATQAGDLPAMKLLMAHGADPKIASIAGNTRQPNGRTDNIPAPAPGAPPAEVPGTNALLMASGAGYDGNFQVLSPLGFMPALTYLVEELHMDVNVLDAKGYSAVHYAAFRGDNDMIKYLVSKGANPKVVAKDGMTTVDYANGPVQRLQPFPETIKLLESMGAINNHKCKSC